MHGKLPMGSPVGIIVRQQEAHRAQATLLEGWTITATG